MNDLLKLTQKVCGQEKTGTTIVPSNFWKGEKFGQLPKWLQIYSCLGSHGHSLSIPKKKKGNQSLTPISGETLVSRIIYCSICHVSKAYFHCSISSRGQACHHLSMLWCNNLKLENSHRTKSGTESRRHIQPEFVEASLQSCQFY